MKKNLVKNIAVLTFLTVPAAVCAEDALHPLVSNESSPFITDSLIFQADDIKTEQASNLTTATGNVFIALNNYKLEADSVTFNEKTEVLTAKGNVRFFENGVIIFADYLELTKDLQAGFLERIRILFADDSRLAAKQATRREGKQIILKNGVYSPCHFCKEDPSKPLVWQLKSTQVTRDEESENVYYRNATLEMFNIPVFYTPYLSHPDPAVKRRNGFLAPTLGSSNYHGAFVGVPYYVAVSPSLDFTLLPVMTVKNGPYLGGEYRQHFNKGVLTLTAGITKSKSISGTEAVPVHKSAHFRGFLSTEGKFDYNDQWRWGFDINRASDPTFLQNYSPFLMNRQLHHKSSLKSTLFTEGFYGKDYASAEAITFQGLRSESNPRTTPVIAPLTTYQVMSDPGNYGEYWTGNANFLALTRPQGTNTRRLSLEGSINLPYISRYGEVYNFGASLRGDGYNVDHYSWQPGQAREDYVTGRLLPKAYMSWRLPFVQRRLESTQLLVEPIISLVVAPDQGNYKSIPNEDSQDFELTETNVMSPDRFAGLDKVDTGQRINYGFNIEAFNQRNQSVTFFLAQSRSLKRNTDFTPGSGVEGRVSDYVGQFKIIPGQYYSLAYRFRTHHGDFRPRRNQITFEAGPPIFKVVGDYILISRKVTESNFSGHEQIASTIRSQFTKYWATFIEGTWNLGRSRRGALSEGIGVHYQDECFEFKTTLKKTYFKDRDIKPDTTIMLNFGFKNLGQLSTSAAAKDHLK